MNRDAARRGVSVVLSLCLLLLLGAAQAKRSHEFVFDASNATDKPKTVHLAGSFNGWSRDATPMKETRPGYWTVTVELNEGKHLYKFVADGDKWLNDPNAERELEEDDGHGGKNSGLIVGADPRKLPPAKPDHVNREAVLFNAEDPADVNVFEFGKARIRVRAQAGDVELVTIIPGSKDMSVAASSTVLHRVSTHRGFDVFGGVIEFNPQVSPEHMLTIWDGKDRHSVELTLSGNPPFETPDWAKHAVWYQIFPERFRNGDPSNDPGDFPFERMVKWTSDWWKTQPGETPGDENFYKGEGNVWKRRYGGDIQGVKQALPYLKQLGVTAIYFNPVFEGESMHKYDTADFRHIDDNFGVKGDLPVEGETDDPATWKWSKSDLVMLDFIEEAHRQGFKVIFDGVFNHVGRAHPMFQDVVKNGKNSKYAEWFEIEAYPDALPAKVEDFGKPGGLKFKAWDGPSGHLPVFRKDAKLGLHAPVRDHIFAITTRWLAPDGDPSKGIDGWRLDVPGDIPHPFWIEWRKLVKQTKPDAYISGELWGWAQDWLNKGDQFDAVMNYRFAEAAQDFFVDQKTAIKPSELNARAMEMQFNYPLQVSLVQQNLFDSHDTDRLASMFVNPDRPYDGQNRPQDNAAEVGYDPRKPNEAEWARMRQAVAFQMTFLGAPMIYYGNEAGMWSPDDPSNRQPMVWKELEPYDDPQVKFDQRQFDFFQRAIAVRQSLEPLRVGFLRPMTIDDDRGIYAFARDHNGKSVHVVVNRSNQSQRVELPIAAKDKIELYDWLDPNHADVKLTPDERPRAEVRGDAKPIVAGNGSVSVEVKAYGTMILAPRP